MNCVENTHVPEEGAEAPWPGPSCSGMGGAARMLPGGRRWAPLDKTGSVYTRGAEPGGRGWWRQEQAQTTVLL